MVPTSERTFGSVELVPPDVDVELFRRTSEVGGLKCDYCHKTVQELGVTRLKSCSRCKASYYCGTECQTTAGIWVTNRPAAPPRVVKSVTSCAFVASRTVPTSTVV